MQNLTNFKNIEKTIYGEGAFDSLVDILKPLREKENGVVIFIVDYFFKDQKLATQIPSLSQDIVFFINVNPKEPTTDQVDDLRDQILYKLGSLPSCVVAIGGGAIMDIGKALSLMLTNEGSSVKYQGLDLVKKPGVYKIGIPTISGTGAECSMTAVLSGPEKKLGLKCEWTVFNQVILDPLLTKTVPRKQWFYTGMDTYIHNIEAESGMFYNLYSKAYGDQSLEYCRDVFLRDGFGQNSRNNDKLMIASLFGGLSLTYSEVGACHALSYGLSVVFGMKHGYANCLAFNHLEEFYGKSVDEFRLMLEKNKIKLPKNISNDWSDKEVNDMAKVAYNLGHMWTHAIGYDWKDKFTIEDIEALYRKL